MVVLCNLADPGGALPAEAADKLVLSLVNVERDAMQMRTQRVSEHRDGFLVEQPPLHLNLLLMVAATHGGTRYAEALKLLSATIAFFQSRPVFDHQNSPALDPRVDRIALDLEPMGATESHNLWGILGGRYLPSALYRLRMIVIDPREISATPPRIEDVAVETRRGAALPA
ncbi:MAG: hypothetical protein RL490_943 [Pseudomonadota bacterium]